MILIETDDEKAIPTSAYSGVVKEVVIDVAGELLSFLLFGILASVLGYAGFMWEEVGLTSLLTGDIIVGLWYVYMGGLALYVGIYLIGYQEIPTRILVLKNKVTQ